MGVQIEIATDEELLRRRGVQKGGKVQKYIDSSVVRFCDRYCPFLSGTLKRAIGTVFGSGHVRYNTPYAKAQYYGNSGHGKEGMASGGLRGRMWFERMKTAHKDEILKNAAEMAGARRRE